MGWIGSGGQLFHALRTFGCAQDEAGRFKVFGESPVSFLGMGEEYVVPDGAEVEIGGRRVNLCGLLSQTSYGAHVTVI